MVHWRGTVNQDNPYIYWVALAVPCARVGERDVAPLRRFTGLLVRDYRTVFGLSFIVATSTKSTYSHA